MSFEVLERLREIFNHLKSSAVDAILEENFEIAVGKAFKNWKATDEQTKKTITVLITAICSKIQSDSQTIRNMYLCIAKDVRIESTLSLGVLLCSAVKKDKIKADFLHELSSLPPATPQPQTSKKPQATNPLERDTKADILYLSQCYARFASRSTDDIDFMRLRREMGMLSDMFCISAMFRVVSEHVFVCNRLPLAKYPLTRMAAEEIGLIGKFSLKKLHRFSLDHDAMPEVNQKSVGIVSQSIVERIFMKLRAGEGTDLSAEIKAVYHLKQKDTLMNNICSKMCSEIKSNPTYVALLESFKLGNAALEILCDIDLESFKKVASLMALNMMNYLKVHKIENSQAIALKTSVFKILAISHESAIQLHYQTSKELLYISYRILQQLLAECPSIFNEDLLDQLMTQNTKRKCIRSRVKEVDIILWLIFKAADASKQKHAVEHIQWPAFFTSVFNYAKDFDEKYRLGLQLSSLELLTGLVKKHGNHYHNSLEDIFKAYKSEIELTFHSAKNTDFGSMVRYLNYRLSNILCLSKEQTEFKIEPSLIIKENLADIQSLILRESGGGLSEDHSIKLLKALNDTNRFNFIRSVADNALCIRSLDNIASAARLHHYYSLEAIAMQCSVMVLLYEDSRSSVHDAKMSAIHSMLVLSTCCRYASALDKHGDANSIAWMTHCCRLVKSVVPLDDKMSQYLYLSALQDIKNFARTLGHQLCARYEIEINFDDIDKQILESVVKHKSYVRHFICYVRLIEDKVTHCTNPYTRAICIKELVSAVACLKEQILLHDKSDIREEVFFGDKNTQFNAICYSLADSNMYFTEMSIVFRRILKLAFSSASQLTMYNLCAKAAKLSKSLSVLTQSFDDYIIYLESISKLETTDVSSDQVAQLLSTFNIDIKSKLNKHASWRSILEDNPAEFEGIFLAVHPSNHGHLVELLSTTINDSLSSLGHAVCSLATQASHRPSAASAAVYDIVRRRLSAAYPRMADVVFDNGDVQACGCVADSVDGYCEMLEEVVRGGAVRGSLRDKRDVLERVHVSVLTVFFSRVASFNREYELLVGKVSEKCFWISISYGLHSLARCFLEIITHFAFCHAQISTSGKGTQTDFWLSSKNICKMFQVSINPSYDIKRFVKLIGLDILKKRESYGRHSLKRLTMRRAETFKEFYKYSLVLKGNLSKVDKLHEEHLESFSNDPLTPLLMIININNILDCLHRSNQIPVLCRHDGTQWTHTIKSPDLSMAAESMIKLLADNERELRDTMSSENTRAREYWSMRHRYEKSMADSLAVLEDCFDEDLMYFDARFRMPVCSGAGKDARAAALHRVMRFKNHSTSSNRLLRKLSIKYGAEPSRIIHSSSSTVSSKNDCNGSLLLLIDGPIFTVPFEHLPAVSEIGSQIYRVPHISECSTRTAISKELKSSKFDNFARNIEEDHLSLQTPRCYYLVNPSGDLKATETRMKDYLDKKIFQWKGLIGIEPRGSEIATYLRNNCHFLYH